MMRPATAPLLVLVFVSSLIPASSNRLPHHSTTTSPSPAPLPILPISNTFYDRATNSAAATPETLLNSFCKRTSFPELCLKSIHEAEPSLTTINSATVLAALIKAVDAKIHEARAFARILAACSGVDARMAELLRDCAGFYNDALDNLESARKAVRAGDAGTRDAMLSAMVSDFDTCDDGFQEFGVKSPLANWCKMLRNMTDNCLVVANLGKPQGGY